MRLARPLAVSRAVLALALCGGLPACSMLAPDVPLLPSPLAREATRPESVRALAGLGDRALAGGDLTRAREYYEKALVAEPQNPALLARYGDVLLRAGQREDALDVLARATELAPDQPDVNLAYARALLAIGRPDDALGFAEKAKVLASKDPRVATTRGVALDLLRRPDEAQAAYREALAIDPGHVPARVNLALSLGLAGNAPEGQRILGEAPASDDRLAATAAMLSRLSGARSSEPRFDGDPAFVQNIDALTRLSRRPTASGEPATAWDEMQAPAVAADRRSDAGEPAGSTAVASADLPEPIVARPLEAPSTATSERANDRVAEPSAAAFDRLDPASRARPQDLATAAPDGERGPFDAVATTDLAALAAERGRGDAFLVEPAAGPVAHAAAARPLAVAEAPTERGTPSEHTVRPAARAEDATVARADLDRPLSPAEAFDAEASAAGGKADRSSTEPGSAMADSYGWVVQAGRFADAGAAAAAWTSLRPTLPTALRDVPRLAAGAGPQPILAGPFQDRAQAETFCAALEGTMSCAPVSL